MDLREAIENGRLDLVQLIVEQTKKKDHELLILAIYSQNLEIIKYLTSKGYLSDGALFNGVITRNIPIVEHLLDRGLDVRFHDDEALSIAIIHNDLPMIKCLLLHGANIKDRFSEFLEIATLNEYNDIIEFLQSL